MKLLLLVLSFGVAVSVIISACNPTVRIPTSGTGMMGSMNGDLYYYIQGKASNDIIKVEIVVPLTSHLDSTIRARGYKVNSVGETQDARFIYAELSKKYIIELAYGKNPPYMQLEPVYVTD